MRVCSVTQSCPTPCDPMDWSLPGSSVHEISQARILEWGVISFSRASFRTWNQTCISCICRQILYYWSHLGSQAHFTFIETLLCFTYFLALNLHLLAQPTWISNFLSVSRHFRWRNPGRGFSTEVSHLVTRGPRMFIQVFLTPETEFLITITTLYFLVWERKMSTQVTIVQEWLWNQSQRCQQSTVETQQKDMGRFHGKRLHLNQIGNSSNSYDSRGSSQTRDWTQVSCIAGRFFTIWVTREAQVNTKNLNQITN